MQKEEIRASNPSETLKTPAMLSFHNESEFLDHWKFPPLFYSELLKAERALETNLSLPLCDALCELPLEVFAALTLGVPDSMPSTQRRLPSMPLEQVQRDWTGTSGWALMAQSLAFIRTLMQMHAERRGRLISQCRILDFGCGWGRLLRLLMKFAPEKNLFGVDPWDKSIALCLKHGMRCSIAQSQYLPKSLPFDGPFDVIYAFSVFTHLSWRAAKIALGALRPLVSDTGLLLLTIRPIEYWNAHNGAICKSMTDSHNSTGFAHHPHRGELVEGEIIYGDTSISLECLEKLADTWQIFRVEWSSADPMQTVVALAPRQE